MTTRQVRVFYCCRGCGEAPTDAMTDAITPTDDPAERGLATCGNTCIDRSAGSVDLHHASDVNAIPNDITAKQAWNDSWEIRSK
tara:strand:+ start:72 stop:323 length:252 start_codon:yes stop_codon:yes gene_type:complete